MRKSSLLTILAMLVAAALIVPALTQAKAVEVGTHVGDVTKFTGNVQVFTGGKWVQLRQAPFALKSTDKIMTKAGLAEVVFVGGGSMKVNRFSMLDVRQMDKTEGLIFKKTVKARRVNVLVGEVWFEVTVKRDRELRYSFKTPTMTAAVRGSTVLIKVELNGQSFVSSSGSVTLGGTFRQHPTGTFAPSSAPVNEVAAVAIFDALERIGTQKEVTEITVKEAIETAIVVMKQEAEAAKQEAQVKADTAQAQAAAAQQQADTAKEQADAAAEAAAMAETQAEADALMAEAAAAMAAAEQAAADANAMLAEAEAVIQTVNETIAQIESVSQETLAVLETVNEETVAITIGETELQYEEPIQEEVVEEPQEDVSPSQ